MTFDISAPLRRTELFGSLEWHKNQGSPCDESVMRLGYSCGFTELTLRAFELVN